MVDSLWLAILQDTVTHKVHDCERHWRAYLRQLKGRSAEPHTARFRRYVSPSNFGTVFFRGESSW